MFILRFDVESAYALHPSMESDENWRIWLEETLASVEQITRVLKRYDAPATFCIVGKVLERAGDDLAGLLKDNPLFDIASHTYSHMGISSTKPEVLRQFGTELEQTSDLIARYFRDRSNRFLCARRFLQGTTGSSKAARYSVGTGIPVYYYRWRGTTGTADACSFHPTILVRMDIRGCLKYQLAGIESAVQYGSPERWLETCPRICGRNNSGNTAYNDR